MLRECIHVRDPEDALVKGRRAEVNLAGPLLGRNASDGIQEELAAKAMSHNANFAL
jgi:hypothetical protein